MTTRNAADLADELIEAARDAVRAGQASSVSAYLAALEEPSAPESLADVLADMDAEYGPVNDEDRAWARQVIDRMQQ